MPKIDSVTICRMSGTICRKKFGKLSLSQFSANCPVSGISESQNVFVLKTHFSGEMTQIRAFFLFFHIVSVSFLLFWVGVGFVCLFFASFLVSTTCQVGHFDSHTFWFLIEFFIENLVLTGGRYMRTFGRRSLLLMPLCSEGPPPFENTFGGSPLVLCYI